MIPKEKKRKEQQKRINDCQLNNRFACNTRLSFPSPFLPIFLSKGIMGGSKLFKRNRWVQRMLIRQILFLFSLIFTNFFA